MYLRRVSKPQHPDLIPDGEPLTVNGCEVQGYRVPSIDSAADQVYEHIITRDVWYQLVAEDD